MKRQQPAFKETQLFDWDAEPIQERESTFFQDSKYTSVPLQRAGSSNGAVLLLACGLVLGAGFVCLVVLTPLLHRLMG